MNSVHKQNQSLFMQKTPKRFSSFRSHHIHHSQWKISFDISQ